MSIWTIILGTFSLWVFVCLWVTIPLATVDESAWHYKMVPGRPEGNCAYFWALFFSPILRIIATAIMSVVALCRFIFDWLIMPICGKRVVSPNTREYWKGFLVLPDKRVCDYVEFRYRDYWIGLVALLAVIAWIALGGFGFYSLSGVTAHDKIEVTLLLIIWSILSLIPLYGICSAFFVDSKKWRDFKEGAGLITGKLCRRLEYKKSEVNTD